MDIESDLFMNKNTLGICFVLSMLYSICANSEIAAKTNTKVNHTMGAQVYEQRCILCHGYNGMGEGLIPLKLNDYPSTNLLEPSNGHTEKQILEIVTWGGLENNLSPPWNEELSKEEILSVTKFVLYLRSDNLKASAMIREQERDKSSSSLGKDIYKVRCVFCHGETGIGDGRMSKVIKNPPPYDLTKSVLPDIYLKRIINEGGEEVGRSPKMPPWSETLGESEVDSVILYIKSLRQ